MASKPICSGEVVDIVQDARWMGWSLEDLIAAIRQEWAMSLRDDAASIEKEVSGGDG
jgi:hypothetical protein